MRQSVQPVGYTVSMKQIEYPEVKLSNIPFGGGGEYWLSDARIGPCARVCQVATGGFHVDGIFYKANKTSRLFGPIPEPIIPVIVKKFKGLTQVREDEFVMGSVYWQKEPDTKPRWRCVMVGCTESRSGDFNDRVWELHEIGGEKDVDFTIIGAEFYGPIPGLTFKDNGA